jgi:hypothetical protein
MTDWLVLARQDARQERKQERNQPASTGPITMSANTMNSTSSPSFISSDI